MEGVDPTNTFSMEEVQESFGNQTDRTLPNGLSSKLSPVADFVLGVYMIIICLLTIILNLVVLITVAKRRHSCTPLELLIVNLTAGDLIVGVVAYPPLVWSCFIHTWEFGKTACQVYATTVYFFGTSSISTLASMSLLRYLKTCHPTMDVYINRPTVYLAMAGIYINSLVWSVGPLLGWGSYGIEPFGLSCTLDWRDPSVTYIVGVFIFVYILPVFLMMYSYGRMTSHVCRTQRSMRIVNNRMDLYLTKMTAIMCSCFLLAWTPYAVVALCYVFNNYSAVPLSLTIAAPFFAKSATCFNPIVYFLSVQRFRHDVISVIFSSCVRFAQETHTSTGHAGMTERYCTQSDDGPVHLQLVNVKGVHTKQNTIEVDSGTLLLSRENGPDGVHNKLTSRTYIPTHTHNNKVGIENNETESKTDVVKSKSCVEGELR